MKWEIFFCGKCPVIEDEDEAVKFVSYLFSDPKIDDWYNDLEITWRGPKQLKLLVEPLSEKMECYIVTGRVLKASFSLINPLIKNDGELEKCDPQSDHRLYYPKSCGVSIELAWKAVQYFLLYGGLNPELTWTPLNCRLPDEPPLEF